MQFFVYDFSNYDICVCLFKKIVYCINVNCIFLNYNCIILYPKKLTYLKK